MSDHTDMMLNRAIASADFDAYREDAKDDRIAALEAQVEAAHRAIDSIGLSRCADSHESRDANGCVACDDGKPPLSLAERTEWLIRWLSDDPYPMGPRIAALEAENAALKAELEIARHTHSESWKYVVSRAEKSEAQVDALTAELNAKSEQLTALSGHLEAMINANQRVRAEREEASACAEAALQSELEWVSRKALRLYRRAWDVHHLLLHPDDAAEDRVRVLEEQLSETHRKIANQRDANRRLTEDAHRRKAELAAMKSVAHTEARNWTLTANRLIAARQSRARLVRLVRAKNGEFNHLMKLWGEARAWAAGWRRKAMKSHAMYVHMHAIYHRSNGSANIFGVPYETVVDNALKLFSRAISGTAQQERSWRRMETVSRRARRAAEAAEAQERR